MGVDVLDALKAVSKHVDDAHPEMQNEVKDEVEELEERLNNGGTV